MEFGEMDLFDFTSFFGLEFFKFSGPLCNITHTLITYAVNFAKSLEFLPWLLLVLEDYFSANHQARIEQKFGYFDSNEVFDLVYDIIDNRLQLESNLEN